MADNNAEIQYYLGKISGSVKAIQDDIAEIKQTQIPNGRNRMQAVESKVDDLSVWKKSATFMGASLVGLLGWLEAKINFIGGLFHG